MHSKNLREIVKKNPRIANVAKRLITLVPLSIRLGKDFWNWYAFFEESEGWPIDQTIDYQLNCIRNLLTELRQCSEYYRKRFASLDIQKICSIEEFQEVVPTLSRADFREHFDEIRASDYKGRMVKSQTSGTTGMALQFFHPAKDSMREWAAICHQWKRVEYIPGQSRRAEFRGLNKSGKLIEYYPNHQMIRCSILHLKSAHIRHYADEIQKNQIDFLHGYPSAFYLLAKEICDTGIHFPQPRAILLSSETVYDWQTEKIQAAFPNTKLYAHYGCAERTVLAGWCEYRQEYHILPQYSLVEVDSTTSEIIGTNFYNIINGFVRYRMTDIASSISWDICPDCRRAYLPRITELGGRAEDYLYSSQYGWIPPAIVTYPLKGLKAIQEIQFIQKLRDQVEIHYSTNIHNKILLENELKQIEASLYHLLGKSTTFKFEYVPYFERTSTGKFKWIICTLSHE